MDQKTFCIVASARIDVFAEGIPESIREDFVQDMWVHLLEHQHELSFEKGVGGPLNLVLFRARENWLGRQRMHAVVEPVNPAQLDQLPAPEPTSPEVRAREAGLAIDKLREVLSTAFSEADITSIVDQLLEGRSLAEVARSLGRSPQNFHHYIKKTREAA